MRRVSEGRWVASAGHASVRRPRDGGCHAREERPANGIHRRAARHRRAFRLHLSRVAVHDAHAGRVGPVDRRRLRRPRAASRARVVLRAVWLPAVAPLVRCRARRAPAARPAPLPARPAGADRPGVLRRARRLDRPAVGSLGDPGPAPATGRRTAAVLPLRPEHLADERHEAQPADVVARRRGELLPRAARARLAGDEAAGAPPRAGARAARAAGARLCVELVDRRPGPRADVLEVARRDAAVLRPGDARGAHAARPHARAPGCGAP